MALDFGPTGRFDFCCWITNQREAPIVQMEAHARSDLGGYRNRKKPAYGGM